MPERPTHLADTSAWIEGLRPGGKEAWTSELKRLVTDRKVGIQPIIRVELLSGAISDAEYRRLEVTLGALPQLDLTNAVWQEAEHLGFRLRRRGLSVPVTDLIIASTAIANRCILLHRDRHFTLIARHVSLNARDISRTARKRT